MIDWSLIFLFNDRGRTVCQSCEEPKIFRSSFVLVSKASIVLSCCIPFGFWRAFLAANALSGMPRTDQHTASDECKLKLGSISASPRGERETLVQIKLSIVNNVRSVSSLLRVKGIR